MSELTQELVEQVSALEEQTSTIEPEVINEEQVNQFSEIEDLAKLFNKSVEQIKDESCMYFIKDLTQKMGKVMVKINLKAEELENSLANCLMTGIGEMLVSPAYIASVKRVNKKKDLPIKVLSAIDFPFGENLFKSKILDAKNSFKMGVDGVSVMISPSSLGEGFFRKTKTQIKKLARTYKNKLTLAITASELSDEQLRLFFKIVERFKNTSLLFVFGDEAKQKVIEKVQSIKARSRRSIKVLANIDSAETAIELLSLGVEYIYTQSADGIAKSLVERFNVKSVNLK